MEYRERARERESNREGGWVHVYVKQKKKAFQSGLGHCVFSFSFSVMFNLFSASGDFIYWPHAVLIWSELLIWPQWDDTHRFRATFQQITLHNLLSFVVSVSPRTWTQHMNATRPESDLFPTNSIYSYLSYSLFRNWIRSMTPQMTHTMWPWADHNKSSDECNPLTKRIC